MPPELEEHDLPAELQQLAARLSREAGDLANQYPPTQSRAVEAAAGRSAALNKAVWLRRLLGGGLAASGLLAIGALSLDYWFSIDDSRDIEPHSERLVSEVPAGIDRSAPVEIPQSPGKVHPVSIGIPGNASASSLSAPEWEAVLDLTPAQDWEGVELSL